MKHRNTLLTLIANGLSFKNGIQLNGLFSHLSISFNNFVVLSLSPAIFRMLTGRAWLSENKCVSLLLIMTLIITNGMLMLLADFVC